MKKINLFLLFFCAATIANAQKIDSVLNIYANEYQPEKTHIHFDKMAYNKGETIWYKAYLLAGSDWSLYSKNFYADWYDDKGKLIQHTASPLFESSAKGQFQIPANYTGQFVHVKSYTQWMLNFGDDYVFEKDIPVSQPTVKTAAIVNTTTVNLFPEGGSLVNGISSRIAFKAENQYGKPVYIVGAIKNNKNEFIDSFAAEHDGMGAFNVQPKENEIYTIFWMDENGKQGTTPLPVTSKTGATLQVESLEGKSLFFVKRSANVDDNFKTFFLVATMNQHMVYRSRINLAVKTTASAEIPTAELPTGILQLTLFTADWKPFAERIVFVNNHDYEFFPSIKAVVKGLDKRKRNLIEILVGDTLPSNMSVSITDADLGIDKKTDIVSRLLLSADLKGNIYNAPYYFSSNADSVAHHLDLVMLTNGWRKYKWDDIVAGKFPKFSYEKETEYLQIKGKVFGNVFERRNQNQSLNVFIQAKDSSKQFVPLVINPDGSFSQSGIFFYDTVKLFYMFNGDKDRKLTDRAEVKFQSGLLPQPQNNLKYLNLKDIAGTTDLMGQQRLKYFLDEQERLKKLMAQATLQEVVVKARVKSNVEVLDEKYASGLFSGGDGYQFDVGNDVFAQSSTDVFRYLQGKVAGLQINYNNGEPTLSWRQGNPSLYMDEMVTESNVLQGIPMSDIAYIKVFRPPFFGATGGGGGGAIAIYTKRGTDGKRISTAGPGLTSAILAGYTTYKQFYSPNYADQKYADGVDVRSTLYWNPYVLTDKKNKTIQIEFYNNDVSKKLHIVLEGMNSDGKLARVEKTIE